MSNDKSLIQELPEELRRQLGQLSPKLIEALVLDSRKASSIEEFCRRHSISKAHYFNLQKRGQGPRVMRVGARVLITPEAEAEWRKAREADYLEGAA